MKKILLIGGAGLVGSRVADLLAPRYEIIIGGRSVYTFQNFQTVPIDITNKELVNETILTIKPDVVIHLAALTSVELCEQKKEEAFGINVKGTENVMIASQNIGAHLIFISTGFVFDGENPPFEETDTPNPTHYYGETKYQAEQLVKDYKGIWSTVRFNYPYRGSFDSKSDCIRWMLPKLAQGEKITVVEDQKVRPIFIDSIAKGIEQIISKELSGYFHFADKETFTWMDLAKLVAEVFEFDTNLIEGVSYKEFLEKNNRIAVPLDVSLDTKMTEEKLSIQMISVREGLEEVKKQRDER